MFRRQLIVDAEVFIWGDEWEVCVDTVSLEVVGESSDDQLVHDVTEIDLAVGIAGCESVVCEVGAREIGGVETVAPHQRYGVGEDGAGDGVVDT